MEKPDKAPEKFSLKREIAGIVFLAAGVFVFVSIFWPEATDAAGRVLISGLLVNTFGAGIFLLPYFLLLAGIFLVLGKVIEASARRGAGLLMSFMSAVTIWDILQFSLCREFTLSNMVNGGGLVGRIFNFLLHWTGIAGAYIILVSIFIVGIMLTFNFSWQGAFLFWQEKAKERAELAAALKAEEEKAKEEEKAVPVRKEKFKPFIDPAGEEKAAEEEKPKAKKEPKRKAEDKLLSELEHAQNKEYPDGYKLPPFSLLDKPKADINYTKRSKTEDIRILESTLASFNVEAKVVDVSYGPSITRYELEPGPGVRINKIAVLADDISLSLASSGVRIEAPVPGKSVVGIEIPNDETTPVTMYEVLTSKDLQENKAPLICALGKDVAGKSIFFDLAKMPHVLIAGSTGSGKSVCINSVIASILFRNRPDEVKFIMIDPKKVELSIYNGIPHLLTPVVTDPKLASVTLKNWAIKEMERRYEVFSQIGVKNLEGYNGYIEKIWEDCKSKDGLSPLDHKKKLDTVKEASGAAEDEADPKKAFKKMPYIVVVIDELADLMMVASSDVESSIIRLAQLARATGIHLVIATQRPSVNVITGLIKANVPSRIAFAVSSQIDSRVILDGMGAEKLLGRGDMLYSPVGMFKPMRMQGVFLSEEELNKVVNHVKKQAKPEYSIDIEKIGELAFAEEPADRNEEDPLYEEAKQVLKDQQKPSISFLQRRLRIGYNRAARLFEELETAGEIFREKE
ncbi:MAG: DNA translocase FtsK [Candidatus Margulisiibacteriota bacterium]|jgi:S-DNA-T family DNA segregation ATPase FtsK/SpoIIIE